MMQSYHLCRGTISYTEKVSQSIKLRYPYKTTLMMNAQHAEIQPMMLLILNK